MAVTKHQNKKLPTKLSFHSLDKRLKPQLRFKFKAHDEHSHRSLRNTCSCRKANARKSKRETSEKGSKLYFGLYLLICLNTDEYECFRWYDKDEISFFVKYKRVDDIYLSLKDVDFFLAWYACKGTLEDHNLSCLKHKFKRNLGYYEKEGKLKRIPRTCDKNFEVWQFTKEYFSECFLNMTIVGTSQLDVKQRIEDYFNNLSHETNISKCSHKISVNFKEEEAEEKNNSLSHFGNSTTVPLIHQANKTFHHVFPVSKAHFAIPENKNKLVTSREIPEANYATMTFRLDLNQSSADIHLTNSYISQKKSGHVQNTLPDHAHNSGISPNENILQTPLSQLCSHQNTPFCNTLVQSNINDGYLNVSDALQIQQGARGILQQQTVSDFTATITSEKINSRQTSQTHDLNCQRVAFYSPAEGSSSQTFLKNFSSVPCIHQEAKHAHYYIPSCQMNFITSDENYKQQNNQWIDQDLSIKNTSDESILNVHPMYNPNIYNIQQGNGQNQLDIPVSDCSVHLVVPETENSVQTTQSHEWNCQNDFKDALYQIFRGEPLCISSNMSNIHQESQSMGEFSSSDLDDIDEIIMSSSGSEADNSPARHFESMLDNNQVYEITQSTDMELTNLYQPNNNFSCI